jgi:hypothetical protein
MRTQPPHSQEASNYARENSLIYMDTSAKTALNVRELFVAIGEWECPTVHHSWAGDKYQPKAAPLIT